MTGLNDNATRLKVTPLTVTGRRLGDAFHVPIDAGSATLRIGRPPCTWYLVEAGQ